MKTAKYKKIGEYLILDRFDTLPIDGALTKKRTDPVIESLPEKQAVNEKIRVRMSINAKGRDALKKGRIAQRIVDTAPKIIPTLKEGDKTAHILKVEAAKKEFQKNKKAFDDLQAQDKACECELNELNAIFGEKAKQYRRDHPVYCQPRKNEVALSGDQFEELFKANAEKSQNELIALEISETIAVIQEGNEVQEEITTPVMVYGGFSVVDDYRGVWWSFSGIWQQLNITELGAIPDNGHIKDSDLTPEQREEIRLQSMTAEEKTVEYESKLAAAKKEAVSLTTEYQFDGMTADKAIAAAKTCLEKQTVELKTVYGVE